MEGGVRAIARSIGLTVRFAPAAHTTLSSWRLPLIAVLDDGELALVTAIGADGEASITLAGSGGLTASMKVAELAEAATLYVLPRPARSAPDARVDAYIRPFEENWLRRILLRDGPAYTHVAVASVVTNLLGLAGVIFSMQVYDRVVPAKSFPTLYILFVGVLIAIGFDFMLRRLRVRITDMLGKRADLRMSDQVFGHALRVRKQSRPSSTGSFIAQLRDLDQVRELLTSSTVAAVADLPFFLMFLAILWFIGGWLALVPMGALVLMVVPGLMIQRRLRAAATEAARESSLRNALLVEAVQGMDDIKSLQAEQRFQGHWNHYNAVAGQAQLRLRGLTGGLTAWTQNVQSATYATVIFAGAPMVMAGDLTTGALVATSILASRMMAPLAQVTQLLSRFQQARVAMRSLDQIMALPVDHPDAAHRIPLSAVAGRYTLRQAIFAHAETTEPVLTVRKLDIGEGERIAVLGRNGAGKSTLLHALSGLIQPMSGEVLLDDLSLAQVDPADVRRDVGYVAQGSRLFHGTIRENLTLGAPNASNEDILAALSMTGAEGFVRRLRSGLEHIVQEGGAGLSGGEVQALLLSRMLIRQPQVVLLDEPTAAMDEAAERHFIARFGEWSRGRTVVIATHRMRVLDLTDRVIVLNAGAVALDQEKQAALRTMRGGDGRQEKAA